ncbi:gamma-aminobutyric acid receptor subunit beta-like isoform X2 [Paramacrobiotus metropolitanus]|nr:gamma-aminobutyric acid receptor subunit beta-like isoform X2 [Paramacrobiotus metropolitanus]XP_055333663.1 gamma-aminobutyric acid receptor subunit beta-like isoform X2 [Paramacrobiotus metropolitanus]
MSAASVSASSAKSLPFHSLPLMLAMSLFINSSTSPTTSGIAGAEPSPLPPGHVGPGSVSATDDPPPKVSVTKLLNDLLADYDKRVRPNYGAKPVEVDVTMHISSISSMSEVDMDFTIDFYFRQFWKDPRLTIETFPSKVSGEEQITVGSEMMDKIWMPDTFFPNEKNSFFHQATTMNKFLRIKRGGSVYTSVRLTTTLACELDLAHFPLDYQNCSMEIESYGYATTDIKLFWKRDVRVKDQVEFSAKKIKLPQFRVLSATPKSRLEGTGTGEYSRLSCEFSFSRRIGYYVIQIYLPSSLIVVISWVSFWLSRESTPARVSLGVTTVLTMTTLMSSTNSQLPKVSYAKGIDVYLGTCFVMVFASLLEYAAVGYCTKRMKMRAAKAGRPMAPPVGSVITSHSHTAGSPTKALQHILGSNHSLQHPHTQEQQPLTCRNALSSPGLDTHAEIGSRYAEHGSLHGRRSVEFRYKSWGSDQSAHAHPSGDPFPPPPGNGPVDIETGLCRSYSLPKVTPKKKREFKSSEIDKYSRISFPLVFVAFNLAYWFIYLNISAPPGLDLEAIQDEG